METRNLCKKILDENGGDIEFVNPRPYDNRAHKTSTTPMLWVI